MGASFDEGQKLAQPAGAPLPGKTVIMLPAGVGSLSAPDVIVVNSNRSETAKP
jgi:hypothetical protein